MDNTLSLTVDEVRTECQGVIVLVMIDARGRTLPPWNAGAHIDVHLPNDLVRQYSLCGDPQDRSRYEIAVLRDPNSRGGSEFLHAQVKKGATLTVSAPRNHFHFREAQEYLFVAGGIGITPLIPMIAAAQRSGVPFAVRYAGSRRSAMAFVDLVDALPNTMIHASDEGPRLRLEEVLTPDLSAGCLIYSCGPARLLDALSSRCAEIGLTDQLHIERFAAAALNVDTSKDQSFDVELARSNKVIEVGAEQTILDALAAAGIKVTSSCAEGICGSCETAVLDGDVDHRDQILDDDEKAANEVMMICCSRATSRRLVLDI
ncbi:cytochrome [Mycobacterium sp. MS1601]|nr:cytochrome [Mycobacterium sp. MS1601]